MILSIDINEWKEYRLSDLFDIKKGKRLTKLNSKDGETPFISSSEFDNAWTNKISSHPLFDGNTITVNYDGSVAEAFYQPVPYWALDSVNVLYPKFPLNVYRGLFFATVIRQEKYRFSYGRKWGLEKMREAIIKLPTKDDHLDFEYMESFIKSLLPSGIVTLDINPIRQVSSSNESKRVNLDGWKEFCLTELFDISSCQKITSSEYLKFKKYGCYPYITAKASNNGVEGMFDYWTEEGNVLTVESAAAGYCSYQPTKFSASSDVKILKPKFMMDKYIAQFLTTILNQEQYRFSYARKAGLSRLIRLSIKLPFNGEVPHWDFMLRFIKSLPYASKL
jgi:restriction endonuclease S subunit